MIRKLLPLACLTLVLSTAARVAAQSPPDIALSDFAWRITPLVDYNPKFDASKTGNDKQDYGIWSLSPPYLGKTTSLFYEPQVTVENLGHKTIRTVTWEYVFFRDSANLRVLKKYKFRNKKQIAAGERAVLKSGWAYGPAPSGYQAVHVLRIEYTDGSRWQAP
ncbi:MAG: hypothetical protein ACJ74G_05145 [Blastocatellia bacterium]